MGKEAIFIGYRREDTADVAGRVFDVLCDEFGRDLVFKDVDNLRPGTDFGKHIRALIPNCRVVLLLIGPNWIDARDANGLRRLEDPADWVRLEVETALATKGVAVVPVLVNGALMPKAEELSGAMEALTHLHAAIIRRDPDFHGDARRLAKSIRAIGLPSASKHDASKLKTWIAAIAAGVGLVALIAASLFWAITTFTKEDSNSSTPSQPVQTVESPVDPNLKVDEWPWLDVVGTWFTADSDCTQFWRFSSGPDHTIVVSHSIDGGSTFTDAHDPILKPSAPNQVEWSDGGFFRWSGDTAIFQNSDGSNRCRFERSR